MDKNRLAAAPVTKKKKTKKGAKTEARKRN
jgi:hypothetical protein